MSACTLYPTTSPCEGLLPVTVNPYLPTLSDVALPTLPARPRSEDTVSLVWTSRHLDDELVTRETPPVPEPAVGLLVGLALMAVAYRRSTTR